MIGWCRVGKHCRATNNRFGTRGSSYFLSREKLEWFLFRNWYKICWWDTVPTQYKLYGHRHWRYVVVLFHFILCMILMYAWRLIRPKSVANLCTLTVRLLEPKYTYLEEDGPITTFFEYKTLFSIAFFDKWTNKIQSSLIIATVENSKTVLICLFSLETALKCMKVLVCLQKYLRTLWLNYLLQCAPVREVAL